MQLKFDWLTVLESSERGILLTYPNLEKTVGPRIISANSL